MLFIGECDLVKRETVDRSRLTFHASRFFEFAKVGKSVAFQGMHGNIVC